MAINCYLLREFWDTRYNIGKFIYRHHNSRPMLLTVSLFTPTQTFDDPESVVRGYSSVLVVHIVKIGEHKKSF